MEDLGEICQQAGSAVHYLTPQEAAGVIHNMETMHNVYNPLSKYVFGISVGSTITGIAGTSFEWQLLQKKVLHVLKM